MPTPQQPIRSPFHAASTAADVMAGVDLSGRIAIVTGGHSGIGLVTARRLAEAGANVIVPARDPHRAREALAGAGQVEVQAMDLMQPDSIQAFARRIVAQGNPISLLINCAGIMAAPLLRDAQGHESQFATNHLGHYRLTCGLWPALVAGKGRVIAVSSRGHQIAGIDFQDIDFQQRPYDKWLAYGQSKTANALFALALDRRGSPHGIRAFSLHPGQILTDLARHLSTEEIAAFDIYDQQGKPRVEPESGLKTLEQGAATGLWCATSKDLDNHGGVYCEDCNIAPINDAALGRKGVAHSAADPELAERLWALSRQWTGMDVA